MRYTLRRQISFCAGLVLILALTRPAGFAPGGNVIHEFKAPPADTLPEVDTLRYSFIDLSKNFIGRPEILLPFFHRLDLLQNGRLRRVNVVHIGDSHIQADLFSGHLRALLQQRFGVAGRGLVFPYSLARTNGPVDLRFTSPYSWELRRSIYDTEGPPLGICGISLRQATAGATLTMSMNSRHQYGLDYSFDRVTVFHRVENQIPGFAPLDPAAQPSPSAPPPAAAPVSKPVYHAVRSGETLYGLSRRYGCTVTQLQHWNKLKSSRINISQRLVVGYRGGAPVPPVPANNTPALPPDSVFGFGARFALPAPAQQLTLRAMGKGVNHETLYGLLLENSQRSGVLFHQIGVNGVTYHHYNEAEFFWEQFPVLEPDLVIVSLGTNEALSPRLTPQEFRRQVDLFIQQLRQQAPDAAIVLTTNPDVLRRRRYDNPGNLNVRQVILEAAEEHGLAFWDLHSVMGGRGSVRKWRASGLAGSDYIHFTKEGYWLQGQLLFQALMNAYANRN